MINQNYFSIVIDNVIKEILENYDQIIEKFGSFEQAMSAESVVHCKDCVFYNPDSLLCTHFMLSEPIIRIDQNYCSSGVTQADHDRLVELCECNGGWHTPGVILTSREIEAALKLKQSEDA